MTDHALADLGRRLPELRLLTDAGDLEHYGRDWTRRWTPAPLAIALPASVEEVQAIVRWANEHKVADRAFGRPHWLVRRRGGRAVASWC